ESRYLTTFYGMLDREGAFTYCNAGHNAPFLVGRSGVRRLATGGTVLGLFEHAMFDEETVRLEPGDTIVAFSDGVTEAMNAAGEEFGDDRLIASIAAQSANALQETVEGLLGDVRTFCGDSTQSDDVTIVMVKFEGREKSDV